MSSLLSNQQVVLLFVNDKLQLVRLKRALFSFLILGGLLGCGGQEPIVVEKTIVQTFAEDPESLGRGRLCSWVAALVIAINSKTQMEP